MRERVIDISAEYPKPWTDDVVRAADVRATHRAATTPTPSSPAAATRTGVLDDLAVLDLDDVRPIRDEIERRVRRMLAELEP
jgi:hypothetical protein